MSNSEDTASADEHRGPEIRSNAVADPLHLQDGPTPFSRARVGTTRQTHLWDVLDYPTNDELDEWDYHWAHYKRQDIAGGLVDKHVEDTWQDAATVHDRGDTSADEDANTDFEEDVETFFANGDPLDLRQDPLSWMKAVDLLGTLGEYGLLVFGIKDGRDADEELGEVTPGELGDETDEDTSGLAGLAFIDVFHEDQVDPKGSRDLSDPETYGRITKYEVTPRDGSPQTVHASRVVHVAEGALTGPHHGRRFLARGINRFIDADKILGASAEGYWRGGYTGYLLKPPEVVTTDGNRQRGTFDDDGSALVEQMREFEADFRRNLTTNGDVEPLESDVSSPGPHMDEVYGALSAGYDVPQSVFKGNETGERATTEDDAQWASNIGGRRNHYAEGEIYRPTVDLLIQAGVFSDPKGDGYDVEWPPLSELTEQEEAELAKTRLEAISAGTNKQPDKALSIAEVREEIGYDPERGSEADLPEDADQVAAETADPALELDESNRQVQAQADRANAWAATDGGERTDSGSDRGE